LPLTSFRIGLTPSDYPSIQALSPRAEPLIYTAIDGNLNTSEIAATIVLYHFVTAQI